MGGEAVVVADRTSGNETVNWYLDQAKPWAGSVELHDTDRDDPAFDPDATDDLQDLTGCTARLTVRAADGTRAVALELTVGAGLTNDGDTIAWAVPGTDMAALDRVYDVELAAFPGGDEDLAVLLLDGQIVMRPTVPAEVTSS